MSQRGRRASVTAEEFERITGRKATEKDLEWVNCTGEACFHLRCGWCEAEGCGMPLFMCRHQRPSRPAA